MNFLDDGIDEVENKHVNQTILDGNVMKLSLIIIEGSYVAIDANNYTFHGYYNIIFYSSPYTLHAYMVMIHSQLPQNIVSYPYTVLVVITILLSWIIFINNFIFI